MSEYNKPTIESCAQSDGPGNTVLIVAPNFVVVHNNNHQTHRIVVQHTSPIVVVPIVIIGDFELQKL
jgi:hypothetical protein